MSSNRTYIRSVLATVLALGGAWGCEDEESSATPDNPPNVMVDAGNTAKPVPNQPPATNTPPTMNTPPAVTDAGMMAASSAPKNIVETAVAAGTFKTLAKALVDTGLDKALAGAGPFTVFAPTDEAFAKLPAGTLEKLTKDEIAEILKYHVVGAKVTAADVKAGPVAMLSGISAFLSTEGGVKINGAKVTAADVGASNGVIHVIDSVILPPNVAEAATLAGLSTLVKAATDTGIASALTDKTATLTVFAPTNDAFGKLPAGTLESLSKTQLADILKYHVVGTKVLSKDLKAGDVDTLLTGKKVSVSLTGGVTITAAKSTAKVIIADVVTTNGIVHVIDGVLLP